LSWVCYSSPGYSWRPILVNANVEFNSDEAINALVLRSKRLGWLRMASLAILLVYPAVQTYHWYLRRGYVEPGFQVVEREDPVGSLIQFLDPRGIQEIYTSYWLAHVVIFRTEERIVASAY